VQHRKVTAAQRMAFISLWLPAVLLLAHWKWHAEMWRKSAGNKPMIEKDRTAPASEFVLVSGEMLEIPKWLKANITPYSSALKLEQARRVGHAMADTRALWARIMCPT
jgi:hypothetical protein